MHVERVLVLNPGSSSLKWSLLSARAEEVLAGADIPYNTAAGDNRGALVRRALEQAGDVAAVGFRVVHGGTLFRETVRVDPAMLNRLSTLNELAPLHNPVAVECMTEALQALPNALHCAAFDTAFHRTIPDKAATYALPHEWTDRWGIRRFGFHGLSVAYAVQQVARLLGYTPARHVVCHLGAGCSITAVLDGRSIDTTMGFTPLDGVMMATRSGAVDPGMMLYLVRHGTDVDAFYDTLEHRSGLFGVSGVSGDVRDVIAQAGSGNEPARLAYDMFLYSVSRAVGSMAASLGGIDVLTFTGGVGEHQPPLRTHVAGTLRYLRLALDEDVNQCGELDRDYSASGSPVRIMVIRAREDLSILREVLAVATRS